MARRTTHGFASRRSRPVLVVVALVAAALAAAILFLGPLAGPVKAPIARAADPDPIRDYLAPIAHELGFDVVVDGGIVTFEDPLGDGVPIPGTLSDTTMASHARMETVPPWLLDGPFMCGPAACSSFGSDDSAFDGGAVLFHQRLAVPVVPDPSKRIEYGVTALIDKFTPVPVGDDGAATAFTGGSHFWIARWDPGGAGDVLLFIQINGQVSTYRTHARAVIDGQDVFILIPILKEWLTVLGWDTYAYESAGTPESVSRDVSRGTFADPLLTYTPGPALGFPVAVASPSASPPPTPSPTPSPPPPSQSAAASSPPTSAAPSAAPDPGATSGGGGLLGLPLAALGLGGLLVAIALWLLLRGRGKGTPKPTDAPPPPTPPPGAPDAPTPATPDGPTPDPEPGPPDAPAPGPAGPGGPVSPGTPQDPGPIPPPGAGPIPPGPVPPPPPKACEDGDEEWREDKAPGYFLIPPADGKVTIESDPTTPALDAWLAEFGFPRGAPFDRFTALDERALDALLDGLPTDPATIHWVIQFALIEWRLACERKWVCENDVYVPTDDRRILESGPNPFLGRYAVDGPASTVDDVRKRWQEAQAALVAAESAVEAMDAYRRACG